VEGSIEVVEGYFDEYGRAEANREKISSP